MVSDNQQIAEIDGWSGRVNKHGYWVICDPQGEDHYSEVLEIEYDSHTGEKIKHDWIDAACNYIPDYLAPENLHELVRVAEELCPEGSIYWSRMVEAYTVKLGKKAWYSTESLSAALAAAIVESKK